jgi:hypothetical protein
MAFCSQTNPTLSCRKLLLNDLQGFPDKTGKSKIPDMVCAATSAAHACKQNVEGWLQCNTYTLGFWHMTEHNANGAANQKE